MYQPSYDAGTDNGAHLLGKDAWVTQQWLSVASGLQPPPPGHGQAAMQGADADAARDQWRALLRALLGAQADALTAAVAALPSAEEDPIRHAVADEQAGSEGSQATRGSGTAPDEMGSHSCAAGGGGDDGSCSGSGSGSSAAVAVAGGPGGAGGGHKPLTSAQEFNDAQIYLRAVLEALVEHALGALRYTMQRI